MNKSTKARQFNSETKQAVFERDGNCCLFCRMNYHMEGTSPLMYSLKDCMHYINKSAGGLGTERNGVTGCRYHHNLLDNGNKGLRREMLGIMKEHLISCYPDWKESELYYRKWH